MQQSDIQNILIARFSSIGDIVLTTPLVRAVRRRFPNARIDFVTKREFAELMQTNPHITTVYPYDACTGIRGVFVLARQLRAQRYDLLIDLHKNFRTYCLRFLTNPGQIVAFAKQIVTRTLLVKTGINRYGKVFPIPERYLKPLHRFGVVNDDQGLELFPTAADWSQVNTIFEQEHLAEGELVIGFGPITAHPLKQWPVERFMELGQQLVQCYGARILLFGGTMDVQKVQRIAEQIPNAPMVLCGRLSLLETAAAVQRCDLFVGNDTGIVHIAAAMQRKVIVLYGPTVEEFGFYPYRTQALVLCKTLPCRPCTHTGKGICRLKTHACMYHITTAEVIEAVGKMLGNQDKRCKVKGEG
jgi:lipopolysaccharide heptosyltransferase II